MPLSNATASATSGVYPPLKVPNPSPQIGFNDPEFENLTTAEKLNDRNYRELVYETYPNEPTCACYAAADFSNGLSKDDADILKSSSNFLVCKSGCKQACCSSLRQSAVASSYRDNANKDDKLPPFMPTYCVGNIRDNEYRKRNEYEEDGKQKVHNGFYCGGVNRLRGGGEGEERRGDEGMYPQSEQVNEAMVRRFGDAWNGTNGCVVNRRLEGGGGYEYVERHPINRSPSSGMRTQCYTEETPVKVYPRGTYMEQPQDSHLDTSHLRRSPNACAPTPDPFGTVTAGCCCPGKETLARSARQRENSGPCAKKKPCPGVDCLIKAFRETQEFVDSLGKVPGFAGLGLMDPGESPYFGRDKPKEAHHEGTRTTTTFITDSIALPNPQCVGPCNPQILKSTISGSGDPFVGATPFTIAVPGRGGVVREAVPAMPGPGLTYAPGKSRKRDDKDKPKEMEVSAGPPADIEAGPCGEPRCRAKRRTNEAPEPAPAEESIEEPTKKVPGLANVNGARTSKTGSKQRGSLKLRSGNRSSVPGPGGDRIGRKRSSGRSGRRAIRFVYSAGDTYSGFTCGHKNCIEERRRVPGNMGWLWNLNETVGRLKPRPGWKPGAIARHIGEILREAKRLAGHKSRTKSRSSSSRSRSRSAPSRGKRSKVHKDRGSVKKSQGRRKDDEKEEIEPPPTLHIHRKDGTYYVTMYPIKQDKMDVPKLEEPMKPLQFKIAKNKDDASIASSSTASDMEIEFSPPAAVNRYHKKPNVVHVDTQVKQQEIIDAFKSDSGKKTDKKKGKKGKK